MADDINKKISIDIEVNTDGQQQITQYKAAFDSLRNSISGLASPLSGLSSNISALSNSIDKLKAQNEGLSSSGNKVKEVVTGLSETFDIWSKVVKLVKGGIAALETEITLLEGAISGGLAVFTVFAPEILKWVTSLLKGKEAIDKAKLSLNAMNNALESSDYSKATQQMNDLKINVGLAKKGFLDKKEVLKQYNDTLGKSMGTVSNLNQLETNLVKNGDAYIKMTLLKASAQLALQDAAKKAYEIEQSRLKSDDESLTFWDKVGDVMNRNAGAAGEGSTGTIDEEAQADKDKHNKANQRRQETIDDATKQKDALLGIASKFKADAAAIAKNSGFDFFSGEIISKGNAEHDNDKSNDELKQLAQQRIDALNETERILKDSLTSQLQSTYEAYGNETLAANNHYQEELDKLNDFLNKKLITQKQFDAATPQLKNEFLADLGSITNKYNEQDRERTEQAQNELTELQVKGMKESTEKRIAELTLYQTEESEQLDKIEAESTERIKKLYREINDAKKTNPTADTTTLQHQLDTEFNLQQINCKKQELLEQQTAEAINKIKKEAAEKGIEDDDQKKVNKAGSPEAKLETEKKLITDKYQFEIEEAKENAEEIKKIKADLNKALKDLDDDYKKKKDADDAAHRKQVNNAVISDAKKVADEVLSIVTSSIKQQSDAKIAALEKDKAAELSNSSLTSAQKLAIEQKYKTQEGQIKAKAFKEEQEASIAQAVINGALAITKGTAQTGVLAALYIPAIIAETAAQVAKIAAEKPPAYAKGGLHYQSDGRGGVLPGYSKTDNTNAWLRSGEGIVVSEAMRVPWARNLVSAINVGFGGQDFSITNPHKGYAVGGIFTDGGDANRYYNQPVNDQKNLANTIAYQMINNFPPVYVDVKDVNNQQNILAQTINRVNL